MEGNERKLRLNTINREDLLIKIKMLQAENTLLRKSQLELGKKESYIIELEERLKNREVRESQVKHLQDQIANIKAKNDRYTKHLETQLEHLSKKNKNSLTS